MMTFSVEDDETRGLDQIVKLIPYPHKTTPQRVASLLRQKLRGDYDWGSSLTNQRIFSLADKDTVLLNIGGDIYCSKGAPYLSYSLTKLAVQQQIPVVFWGCSVSERALTDRAMQQDLNRYSLILPRECLTDACLRQVVQNPKRIVHCCDPAFQLPMKPVPLPGSFLPGNTVGINLSPLVMRAVQKDDPMIRGVWHLICRILKQTDMNVCLIPHVYRISPKQQDYAVLSLLSDCFRGEARISLIDRELSCTELKYVISNCRFFLGARTHATIAAYSTAVPTLALSYSVKSLGIARDLFGTADGFAVAWTDLKEEQSLSELFFQSIVSREDEIRARYAKILPDYQHTILEAASRLPEYLQ